MAATCMPDIMAMTFGMWGMDRVLAFPRGARWPAGAGRGTAARRRRALPRQHRAAAAGGRPAAHARDLEARAGSACGRWPSRRSLAAVFVSSNRGAGGSARWRGAFQSLTSLRNVPRNLVGLPLLPGAHRTLPALRAALRGTAIRARRGRGSWPLGIALSLVLPSANLAQYAVPAALGICFLAACSLHWSRDLRHVAAAWWCGWAAGLVALPYVHMAAKYLLPGVPAAALLIVLHARARAPAALSAHRRSPDRAGLDLRRPHHRRRHHARHFAARRRESPHRARAFKRGRQVWAGGQWAFLAYAEDAGANALANTPPLPAARRLSS